MHKFSRLFLATSLLLSITSSVYAADDDGTFTITIQGPDVEETAPATVTPAAQPRRTTPRQTTRNPQRTNQSAQRTTQNTPRVATVQPSNVQAQTPNRAQTQNSQNNTATQTTVTPSQPNRTYNVQPGDTIWSIAHSYVPQDGSINEFQIVASIYRNNPNAFAGRNVNNLIRTRLTIPSDAQIAREDTRVGSRLLNAGTITLPPLANTSNAATSANNNNVASNSQTTNTQTNNDVPEYTAIETKIKEINEEKQNKEDEALLTNLPSNKDTQNSTELKVTTQEAKEQQEAQKAEQTSPNNNEAPVIDKVEVTENPTPIVANQPLDLDVKTIKIMLDENKKSVDEKVKFIEKQLNDAIERMKNTSSATAKTSADSVTQLAQQYDKIITSIQQDLIELKGNVSKLSRDNDRMREMLLANDEKIEDMQLQLSQYSVPQAENNTQLDKPILMILFGIGLLTLVLLTLFLIFKQKVRARSKLLGDDFDVDENVSDDLLLSDDNGSVDIEAPIGGDEEESEDSKTTDKGKDLNKTENVNALDSDTQSAEDLKNSIAEAEANKSKQENSDDSQDDEQKAAQEAWDKAANENAKEESSDDKQVLDEWSQALDEQQKSEESNVEIKSDDESVADEWAAALNEQKDAENKEDDADKSQDALADEWAAALNEQKDEEKSEEKDPQEDLANDWAAALNEQKESEEPSDTQPSGEQEAMADAWSAALNEQKGAESQSETKESSDDDLSQWDEALKEQNEQTSEPQEDATDAADNSSPKSDESLDSSIENSDKEPETQEEASSDDDLSLSGKSIDEALASIQEPETPNANEPQEEERDPNEPIGEFDLQNIGEDIDLSETDLDDDHPINQNVVKSEEEGALEEALNQAIFDNDAKGKGSNINEILNDDLNLDDILNTDSDDKNNEDVGLKSQEQQAIEQSFKELSSKNAEPSSDVTETNEETVDPVEDIQTEDPQDTVDPVEDIQTEEPQDTVDPVEDVQTDEPQETVDPVEDVQVDEPQETVDPVEDVQTDVPQETAEPIEDIQVDEPQEAVDPVEDIQVDEPQDTIDPVEDIQTDEPQETVDPVEEVQIDEPQETVDPVEDIQTDEPQDIAEPVEDIQLDEPQDTAEPVEDIQVDEPQDTVDPVEDVQTDVPQDAVDPVEDIQTDEPQETAEPVEDIQIDEPQETAEPVEDVQTDVPQETVDPVEDVQTDVPQETVDPIEDVQTDVPQETVDPVEDVQEDENKVVTWEVPTDDDEDPIVQKHEDKMSPQDSADLERLEQRLNLSAGQYDEEAESDLMKMLGTTEHELDDTNVDNHETAFSADDIANMISQTNSFTPTETDVFGQEEAPAQSVSRYEKVSDNIGPITSSDDVDAQNNLDDLNQDFEGLTSKQHQYYVDELNLARLYFETGDTEEAMKIVEDVKANGSSDLVEEALKISTTYGSNN